MTRRTLIAAALALVGSATACTAGGRDGALVLAGPARWHGLDGTVELASDGERGRFVVEAAPLRRAVVWEGDRVWRRDGRGPRVELALTEREEARIEAAVLTGTWRRPDGAVEVVDETARGARLRARGGVVVAELALDTAGEPRELAFPGPHGGRRVAVDGWRDAHGRRVPTGVAYATMGRRTDVFAVDSVSVVAGDPALERGAAGPSDASFLAPSSSVPIRRAATGHLFIRPTVDGRDVGWFLFDTGAGVSVIGRDVADELGWEACGEELSYGFGPGVVETRLRVGGRLAVGPLAVDDLVWTEKESLAKAESVLGDRVAGVLGWDVLVRAVVELDPAGPSLVLHDPTGLDRVAPTWRDLTIHHRVPYVTARFEGGQGLFCLDSGAGDLGVIFTHDAVRRLGLLEGREVVLDAASGAGGGFTVAQGELAWFEVAGRRVAPAPALFSTEPDGESDPYGLGFLGGGFLPDRVWLFDYARGRMALLPR